MQIHVLHSDVTIGGVVVVSQPSPKDRSRDNLVLSVCFGEMLLWRNAALELLCRGDETRHIHGRGRPAFCLENAAACVRVSTIRKSGSARCSARGRESTASSAAVALQPIAAPPRAHTYMPTPTKRAIVDPFLWENKKLFFDAEKLEIQTAWPLLSEAPKLDMRLLFSFS